MVELKKKKRIKERGGRGSLTLLNARTDDSEATSSVASTVVRSAVLFCQHFTQEAMPVTLPAPNTDMTTVDATDDMLLTSLTY